jgi:hypothetical protein
MGFPQPYPRRFDLLREALMASNSALCSVVRKAKRSFSVSPSFTLRTDFQRVQMPESELRFSKTT